MSARQAPRGAACLFIAATDGAPAYSIFAPEAFTTSAMRL